MRYAWIDAHRDQYSVSRLCRVVGVSRSGYCQWRDRAPSRRAQANTALDAEVAAIHRATRGSYGRPCIVRQLCAQGQPAGAERVRRRLQRQGLRPVGLQAPVSGDHGFDASPAGGAESVGSAFRRLAAQSGLGQRHHLRQDRRGLVLYLAAILDLASRRIVGWSMSERINADLVCQALRSACWQRKPPPGLLLHSDRGAQYASRTYRKLAATFQMNVWMSRRANAWDNAPMESFFKTLKVERIYQNNYETRAHARLDIVD